MIVETRPRVELQLHAQATVRQYRELGVFVRDCVDRIERLVGRAEWWTIKIVPHDVCYSCDVVVQTADTVVQARGTGFDGAVAGWEAFRKTEDLLRETFAVARCKRASGVMCGCP